MRTAGIARRSTRGRSRKSVPSRAKTSNANTVTAGPSADRSRAGGIEIAAPGLIQHHELRVEDHVGVLEPAEGGDDLGEGPLDKMAASRPHVALVAGHAQQHATAVQLRLVRPPGTRGEGARRRDELQADGAGREAFHAIRL